MPFVFLNKSFTTCVEQDHNLSKNDKLSSCSCVSKQNFFAMTLKTGIGTISDFGTIFMVSARCLMLIRSIPCLIATGSALAREKVSARFYETNIQKMLLVTLDHLLLKAKIFSSGFQTFFDATHLINIGRLATHPQHSEILVRLSTR